jgi:choline-sulfatase
MGCSRVPNGSRAPRPCGLPSHGVETRHVRMRNWIAYALAFLALACGDKSALPQGPSALEPDFGAGPKAVPADQPGLSERTPVWLNLQNIVHLADIDHGGLFIDLGTPARMKYTVGHWKTGWGKDGVEGDTTYTRVTAPGARVYFPLNGNEPFTLRIRLRATGSTTLQPVLNNEALPSVLLNKGPGFAEYDLPIAADKGHAGENQLLLSFDGATRIEDEDVAAAVDSIRIVPIKHAADGGMGLNDPNAAAYEALPLYGALVQRLVVADHEHKAITVAAPTTLAYHLEVPKKATLSMRIGSPDSKDGTARVLVRITPDGASKISELWRGTLGASWQDVLIPLDRFAGSVVKLELSALGQGVVGFASPALLVAAPRPRQPTAAAKSVVLVLIDTQRADHLRAYDKDTRVLTPTLDRMALSGAVFEAVQATENWTKPSVASVLTGLYPASHGVKNSDARLSDKALLLSEVFKQAGFATSTFIANGFISDKFGFDQGWDHYANFIREKRNSNAEHVFRDAASWAEAHKKQRFFMYIQTIDPHVPYDPPPEFLKLYDSERYTGPIRPRSTGEQLEKAKEQPPKLLFDERDRHYLEALYDGEVSFHDRELGVFIERLKKLGLYDDLMIVVTADHGEEFFDHGSWGHGHTVYQELLHAPLMVRFPGGVPAGARVADTASTIDIAPTVLSAAGIAIPDVMEGVDRMPQLLGAPAPALSAAFSDFLDDRRVIRAGRWKLILRGLTPTLFDLQADPHELHELDLGAHPIALRYCRILLGQFLGTRDRGDWLSAEPQGKSVELTGEAADLDDATKAGLKALGYTN